MATLPTELWCDILGLAVHTADLFQTKWDYSPDISIWHGWELSESTYRASLVTKLSICLVSKSWKQIGVGLLYEHVYLSEKDVLQFGVMPKLISIFEDHATDQSGYGRSTKRVDVHFKTFKEPSFQFLQFSRLLNHCYNIRIFNVIGGEIVETQRQHELSSILQARFSHSLRRMRYHVNDSKWAVNLPSHLPDLPLDTLELSSGPTLAIASPPAIKTVSTLVLDLLYYEYDLPSWRFPALRHLTFCRVTNADRPSLQSFMATHGPQLHSLHLIIYGNEKFALLPEFLGLTPNLRCLVLSRTTIDVQWPARNSCHSITHIGIQSYPFPLTTDLEECISGSVFPGLQCVRLLGHSNPVEVSNGSFHVYRDDWLSLLEVGTEKNIRFEDEKCQLLQIV